MSFGFAAPEWAIALVVVPILLSWLRGREAARQRRRLECFGPRFAQVSPSSAPAWWAAAALACVLAAMQPEWGRESLRSERRGSDVVVCLDVSRSMLAADQDPDRLRAAQRDLAALVESGVDDRFALLAFAGEARRIVPLTDDRVSFASLIGIAEPSAVRRGGTDLAEAIAAARAALPAAGERSQAIVVLTDGEDLEARALAALEKVEEMIPIHAVGYGTRAGSKIVIEENGRSGFLTDREGREVVSALDPSSLRALARQSGGSYRDAVDDPGLLALRAHLQEDATHLAALTESDRRAARFAWPLLLAFLCLVFAGRVRR